MSSIIFHTDENQALVATDTLATQVGGEPYMFTTKTFIVPHLQMIMGGTGVGGFLGKWFVKVNDQMIVKGIENLNYHTPKQLNILWEFHRKEFSVPDNITTTVYHFGISEIDGKINSFAYRSANNFQSEPLEYGASVKPPCELPESFNFPSDIKKIMDQQRHTQNQVPENEKIHIGGKILIHHLNKSGFTVYTLDTFEDYKIVEQKIFDNFQKLTDPDGTLN